MRLKLIFILLFIISNFSFINGLYASDSDLEHDMGLLIGWWAEQFAKLMSFAGSSEINTPAETLLNGNFEAGFLFNIGVTKTDTNAYKRLDYYVFERGQEAPIKSLPIFTGLLYGKYGISKDYDIGIKLGGLTIKPTDQTLAVENKVSGLDLRMQMQRRQKEGFDLVGGITINSVKGYINLKSTGIFTQDTVVMTDFLTGASTSYIRTFTGYHDIKVDWDFTSIALRLVGSTAWSFFCPVLGLQVDLNFGDAKGKIQYDMKNIVLTSTMTGTSFSEPDTSMIGEKSTTIPQVNLRVLYGFEFNFSSVGIWYSGEIAGDNNSFALGLRVKF